MSGARYKADLLARLEAAKDTIDRNVSQINVENNTARDEIDRIAFDMKAKINQSISVIEEYQLM